MASPAFPGTLPGAAMQMVMEREDGEVGEVGVEVVKQGVHLSQCDLAGSCPLVAAGPPSCTAVSASTTSCLVTRS